MHTDFDVVIVGAGFAGLTLAKHLPTTLRILIVERKKQNVDFYDSTALITTKTKDLLYTYIEDLDKYLTNSIDSLGLIDTNFSSHFISEYYEPWAFTSDTGALIKRIRSSLYDNVTISYSNSFIKTTFSQKDQVHNISLEQGSVTSRFLVGADGAKSAVARDNNKLSKNSKFLLGQEKIILGDILLGHKPQNTVYHYWFGEFALGYGGWLSPTIVNGKNAFKVGLAKNEKLTRKDGNLESFIDILVKQKHISIADINPVHSYGGYIPINGPLKNIYYQNTLLIGDAAGFCGSLVADGIKGAIVSTKIASRLIAEFFDTNSKKVFKNFGKELNKYNHLYDYYKKQRLYRKLWNLMKRNSTFSTLYAILESEKENFLEHFKKSKDNEGSLLSILLKPKHLPRLIKLAFLIIRDIFKI